MWTDVGCEYLVGSPIDRFSFIIKKKSVLKIMDCTVYNLTTISKRKILQCIYIIQTFHTSRCICLCATLFTPFTHSMLCPCRAHAFPLPCPAPKGLECVFPIWFTQSGRVWFTIAMPCLCRAHAMLCPCRYSQGHGIARPSRDGMWATCPRSASSG